MAETSLLDDFVDFGTGLTDTALDFYERYSGSKSKLNESRRRENTANPDAQPDKGTVQRNADGSPVAVVRSGGDNTYLGLPLWALIVLGLLLLLAFVFLIIWAVK